MGGVTTVVVAVVVMFALENMITRYLSVRESEIRLRNRELDVEEEKKKAAKCIVEQEVD